MREEYKVFNKYLAEKKLKSTSQRVKILEIFLKTERHISADEFYRVIRKLAPHIGYATVYRTLKLICEAGLAHQVDFGDGITRLEHKYRHEHHDHLICLRCGKFFEVFEPEIEKLQDKLARRHKFYPTRHRLQIFGYCKRCVKNEP